LGRQLAELLFPCIRAGCPLSSRSTATCCGHDLSLYASTRLATRSRKKRCAKELRWRDDANMARLRVSLRLRGDEHGFGLCAPHVGCGGGGVAACSAASPSDDSLPSQAARTRSSIMVARALCAATVRAVMRPKKVGQCWCGLPRARGARWAHRGADRSTRVPVTRVVGYKEVSADRDCVSWVSRGLFCCLRSIRRFVQVRA
jgi:hypothetical protein